MAKEKTAAQTATVATKAAQKVGKEVLKLNPDIKEVFVTSDGTAFYARNDAQNHAYGLKNRDVVRVTRDKQPEAAEETPGEGEAPESEPETPNADE